MFHKHEVVSINFTFNIVSFMLPKNPHPLFLLREVGEGVKSCDPIGAFWISEIYSYYRHIIALHGDNSDTVSGLL